MKHDLAKALATMRSRHESQSQRRQETIERLQSVMANKPTPDELLRAVQRARYELATVRTEVDMQSIVEREAFGEIAAALATFTLPK